MSEALAKLPYRPCVGVMLLNKKREVFVARRLDMTSEAWQMPQGGIDEGETPEEALMRELEEEIGTNNAKIIAQAKEWYSYDLPVHLIGKLWKGKYRGQTQQWFLMDFLGDDDEINLETEHPEFSHWRWAEPEILPEIIVPFKRQLYIDLLHEFQDHF